VFNIFYTRLVFCQFMAARVMTSIVIQLSLCLFQIMTVASQICATVPAIVLF
jgi:hypothetical protein